MMSMFDEDDMIILMETKKHFIKYHSFMGKAKASKLFEKFRQSLEDISDLTCRKALLNRKFVLLRKEISKSKLKQGKSNIRTTN